MASTLRKCISSRTFTTWIILIEQHVVPESSWQSVSPRVRGISRTKTGYKVNFTKNDGTRAQTSFAITRSRSKEQAKQFAIDYLESLKAGDAETVQLGASGPRGRSNARQLAIVLDSTIESTIEQAQSSSLSMRIRGVFPGLLLIG